MKNLPIDLIKKALSSNDETISLLIPQSLGADLYVMKVDRFFILESRKRAGLIPKIKKNFSKLIYRRKYIFWYRFLRKIDSGIFTIKKIFCKLFYKLKEFIYN